MKRFSYFLLLIPLFWAGGLSAQWDDVSSSISETLNDVHFISESEGWAVGNSGKIVHTTDGGSSWTEENSGTTENLKGVHMVDASTGYAVGDNGACVKYDGSSWSSIDLGHSRDMFGVSFVDANTGWVSGTDRRLQKTTDGGTSWTNEGETLNSYYDVHMLSSTEGWACGDNGNVYEYDGAGNWDKTSVGGSTDRFEAIHFSSSSNGFVVGQASMVYYYDGSSWTQHSTPLSGDQLITDVHAISSGNAFATVDPQLGGEGKILRYDGTSWSKDHEYSGAATELFYGVHFPSFEKGYAVGTSGLVRSRSGATSLDNEKEADLGLQVGPNPVRDQLRISFGTESRSERRVEILNIRGEQVKSLSAKTVGPGEHREKIDVSSFSQGVYFVHLTAGKEKEVLKVVKND